MKILFITSSHNGLSQRAWSELSEKGHQVKIQLALSDDSMTQAVYAFEPDLILAPFLKKAIPKSIWQHHTCLIVHPGIKGDRGPSSLDWAIMTNQKEWGVTILEAAEEMDAGDIWSSHKFPMRAVSKSNLYRHEVTACALKGIHDAVEKFMSRSYQPEPLDYSNKQIKGKWNDAIKRKDRIIDWTTSSKTIATKIKAADSNPGVYEESIFPFPCFMYGAHEESFLIGKPGQLIAQRDKAICIGTGNGSIWVTHLKKHGAGNIKMAAMDVLEGFIPALPMSNRLIFEDDLNELTFREIWYEEKGNVGYLHFDFYNGAMSTQQCQRLRKAFWKARTKKTKIIVLMGGHDIWSNGIHLNVIENSNNPADESWDNIVAIDDLVHDIITTDSHYVVSALHGNAGAGGAIMALAADEVLAREGIILNPHYKKMGLFGSEYWTYLLPKRVGMKTASELTNECLPLTSQKAKVIGLVDNISGQNLQEFRAFLEHHILELEKSIDFEKFLQQKKSRLIKEELARTFNDSRNKELTMMWNNFHDKNSQYHSLRHFFVHKIECAVQPFNYKINDYKLVTQDDNM